MPFLRHPILVRAVAGIAFAAVVTASLPLGTAAFAADTALPIIVAQAPAEPAAAPEAAAVGAETETAGLTLTADELETAFRAYRGSDCAGCHGWAGNGDKIGENPKGPSLRGMSYDTAALVEIIQCGRPGTLMPSHRRHAYSGENACFGMSEADLGNQLPPVGKTATEDQATAIAQYIQSEFYGRPDTPSLEECQKYYGKKPLCNGYSPAADIPPRAE